MGEGLQTITRIFSSALNQGNILSAYVIGRGFIIVLALCYLLCA